MITDKQMKWAAAIAGALKAEKYDKMKGEVKVNKYEKSKEVHLLRVTHLITFERNISCSHLQALLQKVPLEATLDEVIEEVSTAGPNISSLEFIEEKIIEVSKVREIPPTSSENKE